MEARKERPIIIPKPEMVQAILKDRKTQHRWPMKPQPDNNTPVYWDEECQCWKQDYIDGYAYAGGPPILAADSFECPYRPGDILWVRETCKYYGYAGGIILVDKTGWAWRPNDFLPQDIWTRFADKYRNKWCPAIHMPKWASKIRLEVTDIWVERVQDISGQDVLCEGINSHVYPTADYFDRAQREAFERIWDSLWAKKGFGWDVNPWVWAIAFRRVENEN